MCEHVEPTQFAALPGPAREGERHIFGKIADLIEGRDEDEVSALCDRLESFMNACPGGAIK